MCNVQTYNVLELYCGCGGFGFICGESDGIRMVPTHAVDFHRDSLDTYQLNHPDTKVLQPRHDSGSRRRPPDARQEGG